MELSKTTAESQKKGPTQSWQIGIQEIPAEGQEQIVHCEVSHGQHGGPTKLFRPQHGWTHLGWDFYGFSSSYITVLVHVGHLGYLGVFRKLEPAHPISQKPSDLRRHHNHPFVAEHRNAHGHRKGLQPQKGLTLQIAGQLDPVLRRQNEDQQHEALPRNQAQKAESLKEGDVLQRSATQSSNC